MSLRTGTALMLLAVFALAPLPAGAQQAPPPPAADDTLSLDLPSVLASGTDNGEIVLVHTIGSSAEVWHAVATRLKESFRVYVYELPGHGATPPRPGLSIADAAADLERFIDDNNLVYPTVVGHGMGGLIAMSYVFDHPAMVKNLVVIDAAPRQLADADQKIEISKQLLTNYDQFVAGYFMQLSQREDIADRLVDQALRTHQASFTELLMSSFDFDLSEELPLQAVPILVVGSGMLFPDPRTEAVMARLGAIGYASTRNLNYKVIPASGHFVMLEKPAFLSSVIAAYAAMD